MRCSSCGKFKSYADPPTVEVQSTSIDAEEPVPIPADAPAGAPEQARLPVVGDVEAVAPAPEKKPTLTTHGTVTVEARVVLCCEDCNEEMKDSTIEAQSDFDHDCDPDGKPDEDYDPASPQFEADDPDGEGNSRTETKDRNGDPIKNPRYMRTFYGFDAEVDVKCHRCGATFQVSVSGEEQASSFSELC